MRIRGCTVEYDLNEAAQMLGISPEALERGVETGVFQYYYRAKSHDYRFHEASLFANREALRSAVSTLSERRASPIGIEFGDFWGF